MKQLQEMKKKEKRRTLFDVNVPPVKKERAKPYEYKRERSE
jgi:predicted ABC-type exoprotein transport system permease subunit